MSLQLSAANPTIWLKGIMSLLSVKLKEYVEHNELLLNLIAKELKLKYKNSMLGFLWSFINPFILMAVYTFIFGVVFKSRGIANYPIFLLVGLLPWNFLALSLSSSVASIIGNASLVKKVYFPREFLVISVVAANLVTFMLELVVLFAFLLLYGYRFYYFIPVLMLAIALESILVSGLCLFFASANVYFRDIQQLLSVILLLWFFATPIVYKLEMVPSKLQFFLKLNPMTYIILLYREALFSNFIPSLMVTSIAFTSSVAIFVMGYTVFNRLSKSFAKEV